MNHPRYGFPYYIRRLHRIPNRIYRMLRAYVFPYPVTWGLRLRNRYSDSSIVAPGGPVVSLTTYGTRVDTAYLAVESIGRGTTLPSRIILWLDDERSFANLPPTLERLKQRGLEVRLTDGYGPHTKYYPYIKSQEQFASPLVIADDDQFYPRRWLRDLVQAHTEAPHLIHCHWAVFLGIIEDGVASYASWRRRGLNKPSSRNMAMGVSGVIYPAPFLSILKEQGEQFRACCPRADDIWLHVQALRSGYKVRQLRKRSAQWLQILGSQRIALAQENDEGGNDRQIKLTYTREDLDRLREER